MRSVDAFGALDRAWRSRCSLLQASPRPAATLAHCCAMSFRGWHQIAFGDLVEVNGIEPMTSCLQSRRSPN